MSEAVPFQARPFAGMSETAVRLMLRYGYFMGLYYSMTFMEVEEDNPHVQTLATNGTMVWVNPKFWSQLDRNQKLTATAHEMGHKMLMHCTRRGERDPAMWNIAGDHVINLMLKESRFTPLAGLTIDGKPWSWYCDDKYTGWTTEQVYEDLQEEYEKNGRTADDDLGNAKDIVDFGRDPGGGKDPNTTETKETFEGRVRKEIKEAQQAAQVAGNAPSWMQRTIENAEHVKENWYDVLEQYIKGLHKDDYSWHKWDRRAFVKCGVLAPDMYQPALGDVAVFIDCSGSCWGDLPVFNKHIADVWQMTKPKNVHLRYFQTEVNHEYDQTFVRGEGDVEIHQLGGGGTSFDWLADEVAAMEEQPDVVLVLTDMYGCFGREVDGVPVIWLSTSSVDQAPFGEVLQIQ